MSFFTGVDFYRPCSPPAMTGGQLSLFISAVRDTQLLTGKGLLLLNVKFGRAIDQDEKPTIWWENVSPQIAHMREIDWELRLDDEVDLEGIIAALASETRRVYRASVSLGTPINAVLDPITRTNSLENELNYCPNTLSFQIGPVELRSLSSDTAALVGWMAIGLAVSSPGFQLSPPAPPA